MALIAFELDEQRFERIATEHVPRPDGRTSLFGVWAAVCRQCGKPFLQRSALMGRGPSRHARRRCVPCIKATPPLVSNPDAHAGQPVPATWTPAGSDIRQTNLTHGNEHAEPRTAAITPELLASQSPKWPRKPAKGGFIDR